MKGIESDGFYVIHQTLKHFLPDILIGHFLFLRTVLCLVVNLDDEMVREIPLQHTKNRHYDHSSAIVSDLRDSQFHIDRLNTTYSSYGTE